MQNWFALSDPAMEEALYEIVSLRAFAHLNFVEPIPDEATILNFRQLLEADDIQAISARLIELGATAVLLKLGRQGAFLHVTEDRDRLAASGRCAPTLSRWLGATLHAACFTAEVAGTTGAGDCTIAGLLAALVRGDGPRDALRAAVATGSASVERPDATSGIPDWSVLADRLARGWPRDPALPFPHSV